MGQKRWIPKVGETVTLTGSDPQWSGKVKSVRKYGCKPDQVYLYIENYGYTFANKSEIYIHKT